MPALLSIVVPFHNVSEYLGDCLASLRAQRLADIEVVLVDDGSTDASAQVAEQAVAEDPRFLLLHQDNVGPGPARNTGIREATGTYLTFVDGDDLVSRDGLADLVECLERTGSDWAGGGAARLDAYGVRSSWSHRERHATQRLATSIREYPELAGDRLVWAKVYRREFWVEHGFAFPAMRYEDYPVALAVNITARAVDLLPVRTYYWRGRHRQDSITQRAYDLDNIVDRVRSDDMVLDQLEAQWATGLPVARSLMAEVDLAALLDAFAAASTPAAAQLLELTRHLAERIGPEALATQEPAERIRHHALARGDLRTLRRLARLRAKGLPVTPRAVPAALRDRLSGHPRHWRLAWPGVAAAAVPTDLRGWSPDQARLVTSITDIRVTDTELQLCGTAALEPLASHHGARLSLTLHRTVEGHPQVEDSCLWVESHPARGATGAAAGLGFRAGVPLTRLVDLAQLGGGVHLMVSLAAQGIHRRAILQHPLAGSPLWPPAVPVAAGTAGVFGTNSWDELLLSWHRDRGEVIAARRTGDGLELRLALPGSPALAGSALELDGRPLATTILGDDLVGVASADLAPAREPEPVPTARLGFLALRTADGRSVSLAWPPGAPSLALRREGARDVRLTRTSGGYTGVLDTTAYVHVDEVTARDGELVLCGRASEPLTLEWSRPGRTGPVAVPGTLSWGAPVLADVREWTFRCDLDALHADPGGHVVLLARTGGAEPLAVHVDPALAGRLPRTYGRSVVTLRRAAEHPTGALVCEPAPGVRPTQRGLRRTTF